MFGTLKEDETNKQMLEIISTVYGKNYILNGLDNKSYNMYSLINTAKEL